MTSETAQLSGTQRAAVFLMALGEDFASSVLKHLGPKEVQKLGSAMAALPNINRGQLDAVVSDFATGTQRRQFRLIVRMDGDKRVAFPDRITHLTVD